MADEFNEILALDLPVLQKQLDLFNGEGVDASYKSYNEPGDFSHFTRSQWSGFINRAFTDMDYASTAQYFVRRQCVDSLICKERSLIALDCTRSGYYDLEKQRIERLIKKNSNDSAVYQTSIKSFDRVVKPK